MHKQTTPQVGMIMTEHHTLLDRPDKETLEHITPYAFTIDERLIGRPLARPWRRAIAMLVDLVIVGVLSLFPLQLLALFLLLVSLRLAFFTGVVTKSSKRPTIAWRYLAGAGICAVVALANHFDDSDRDNGTMVNTEDSVVTTNLSPKTAMAVAGLMAQVATVKGADECQMAGCYFEKLSELPKTAASLEMNTEEAKEFFSGLADSIEMETVEQEKLAKLWVASFQTIVDGDDTTTNVQDQPVNNSTGVVIPEKDNESAVPSNNDPTTLISTANSEEEDTYPQGGATRSIIGWAKGIIEDFGLGFGWATFYFTVMLSYFKGRTLGKKIIGIKVIKLDGKPLTLWESFGRYGGYGAGLATGLLGFLQVYWDPNRQAIQDKISTTVVVKV